MTLHFTLSENPIENSATPKASKLCPSTKSMSPNTLRTPPPPEPSEGRWRMNSSRRWREPRKRTRARRRIPPRSWPSRRRHPLKNDPKMKIILKTNPSSQHLVSHRIWSLRGRLCREIRAIKMFLVHKSLLFQMNDEQQKRAPSPPPSQSPHPNCPPPPRLPEAVAATATHHRNEENGMPLKLSLIKRMKVK